jgi:hypothetical protein
MKYFSQRRRRYEIHPASAQQATATNPATQARTSIGGGPCITKRLSSLHRVIRWVMSPFRCFYGHIDGVSMSDNWIRVITSSVITDK